MHGRPNVILSPHLDDAVLSLGGLIAREPERTSVVTFFAGRPAPPARGRWDWLCGFRDSDEALECRIAENRRALRLLGVGAARVRDLGHLDRQYRRAAGPAEAEATRARVASELARLLRDHAGHQADIFAPAMELHADHALLKQALLAEAGAGSPSPGVRFHLYQDMPYSYLFLRARSVRPLRSLDFSKIKRLVPPLARAATVPIDLSEADMARKLAALAAYASQLRGSPGYWLRLVRDFARYEARFHGRMAAYVEVVHELSPGTRA